MTSNNKPWLSNAFEQVDIWGQRQIGPRKASLVTVGAVGITSNVSTAMETSIRGEEDLATVISSLTGVSEIYLKILTKHGWSRNAWIECLIHRARIEIPKFVVSPPPEISTKGVIKDIHMEMLHYQVMARERTNTCKAIVAKGKGSSGESNRGLAKKYHEEVLLEYGPGKLSDDMLSILAGLLAKT